MVLIHAQEERAVGVAPVTLQAEHLRGKAFPFVDAADAQTKVS
jgi:hypothetical protein